jgi:GH15 family glucan-1,4-alpha-glucosidase
MAPKRIQILWSLLILRTQIDNRGAIIAANDSDIVRFGKDTYSYMWGRDGAFVAVALAMAGYPDVCRKFFGFCDRVLSEEGYLYQHYNPDGSLASNWHPWLVDGEEVLPIQEDSTALILWALWIHYETSKDIEFIRPLYNGLIQKSADFLVTHRDPETLLPIPSYDLWEERFGVHSFTVAAVIAGLSAAAKFALLFQDVSLTEKYGNVAEQMKEGLTKHLYHTGLKRYARSGYRKDKGYELDEVIDVSLLGLTILGALPPKDPRMVETMEAIRQQLWLNTPVEGCARYQDDVYQRPIDSPPDIPGNPWFISTLWLGEYCIARAESLQELHEALPYLEWCVKNALPSGVFAEQVHPVNGSPLSISPLTWSHSSFVWTVLQYMDKFNSFQKP